MILHEKVLAPTVERGPFSRLDETGPIEWMLAAFLSADCQGRLP
jgi:hypothetical protein